MKVMTIIKVNDLDVHIQRLQRNTVVCDAGRGIIFFLLTTYESEFWSNNQEGISSRFCGNSESSAYHKILKKCFLVTFIG